MGNIAPRGPPKTNFSSLFFLKNRDREKMLERQATASNRAATTTSAIKFLRLTMQSLILGLGAYLVIERQVTVGAMFAGSFLLSLALQPVEQIVGSWRNLLRRGGPSNGSEHCWRPIRRATPRWLCRGRAAICGWRG